MKATAISRTQKLINNRMYKFFIFNHKEELSHSFIKKMDRSVDNYIKSTKSFLEEQASYFLFFVISRFYMNM